MNDRANSRRRTLATAALALAVFGGAALAAPQGEDYLRWSGAHAEAVGKAAHQRGRVGGLFDTRLLKTERSYNYKLTATWLTPEAIRATARVIQLRSRLSDDDTRALVAEAEAVDGTVVMVEIDPREGSGIIPRDWEALLQPKGRPEAAVKGTLRPDLRDVKALAGVLRRNYDYDRFWVAFKLTASNGAPLFTATDTNAELIVRIIEKEGRVEWGVPASMRTTLSERGAPR